MSVETYTRGTLLWLDDNFLDSRFLGEGSDIDFWRRSFGDTDHRVYRLFNLDLEPVSSLQDMIAATDAYLASGDRHNRFMMAVVDLSVPRETPPKGQSTGGGGVYEPRVANGLRAAEYLRSKGIPFVFLSSSSAATVELAAAGLERIPYFKKVRKSEGAIMPPQAARYILEEFRSHMGWLDISSIVANFGLIDRRASQSDRFALNHFPYFGSYRDFIERWELRSEYAHAYNRIVFRAPRSHSPSFILQCVALVSDGQPRLRGRRIVYLDAGKIRDSDLDALRDTQDKHIIVIRLNGDTAGESDEFSDNAEIELLRSVMSTLRRAQIYFVLPTDESADAILMELAIVPGVFHDDLPSTRLYDTSARSELVRRTSRFVLQKLVSVREGVPDIHPIFLSHPELLIDPVHWAFLQESESVASEISEPFEVLREFFSAMAVFEGWLDDEDKAAHLAALGDGDPLPADSLLTVAEDIFQSETELHPVWTALALSNWLSKSWRTPFDLIPETHPSVRKFSVHSLIVGRMLAEKFMGQYAKSRDVIRTRFDPEVLADLYRAASFLMTPAVRKLLDSDRNIDWHGFEALRWPHAAFPVPSALNEQLKEIGGRYFFAHSNELDMATLLPDGRAALDRLEIRASFLKQRMDWLTQCAPLLPDGWREPFAFITNMIFRRETREMWAADRDKVWRHITCLQRNALRVSYAVHVLNQKGGAPTLKQVEEGAKQMHAASGSGSLLGKIRGHRGDCFPALVEVKSPLLRAQSQMFGDSLIRLEHLLDMRRQASKKDEAPPNDPVFVEILEEFLEKLKADDQSGELGDRILRTLFDSNGSFTSGMTLGEWAKNGNAKPSEHITLFGTGGDVLTAFSSIGATLNHFIRPIIYADGYHFLSLTGDYRNSEKDVTPNLSDQDLHQLLDFFILGAEGLVLQLRWLLHSLGMSQVADEIPEGLIRLRNVPKPDPKKVNLLARGEGTSAKDFKVFLLGYPGAKEKEFVYTRMAAGQYGLVKHGEYEASE